MAKTSKPATAASQEKPAKPRKPASQENAATSSAPAAESATIPPPPLSEMQEKASYAAFVDQKLRSNPDVCFALAGTKNVDDARQILNGRLLYGTLRKEAF